MSECSTIPKINEQLFSMFRFFASSDSRLLDSCVSAKYCPMLTNHTSMESSFIQLSRDVCLNLKKK